MLAEQFGEAVEMQAITRAARYGRMTGKHCTTRIFSIAQERMNFAELPSMQRCKVQ